MQFSSIRQKNAGLEVFKDFTPEQLNQDDNGIDGKGQ